MQATLSPFYSFGYAAHSAYDSISDMDTLRTRYATSSCRDEPAHDPTAPKYDPLGVLSKPAAPVWEKPVYTRTKVVVVTSSPTVADNTFTPRDPRAIEMAAATSPRTLAWAREQGKVDQSIWALAALSLAHSPWADNYSHFWSEDVRAETARFVFGAGAHNLMRTTRRTDPPLHSDVDLFRDIVRAYKTWEESLKPSVAAPPTRTSPRVAQNKRKAVIAAAIETVEEAIEAQEPELAAPPATKRARTTAARKRAAGSPTHAPVISSPLAHSMLLPAAEIEATPAPTRASQRPKKKSQLAREAEEHAAAAAADEARPTARRAASSSASSDISSVTATSASAAPVVVSGKRSRSGSASSASTAVDVVAELAKSEERPAKKARTTKQASVVPIPEPESEDVSADQNEKVSKSPVRKRAPRAQTNRTRRR
ncbi:hypothetical protein PENSPDRAFT_691463 [Peniophora sp. CONT]|nr:hypothetical protein PENSPDRAFT_691463 [Peniophora sp. CONT]